MKLQYRYAVPATWMRDRLDNLLARYTFGALNRCEHLRDAQADVAVLALWSDAAVCARCRLRLKLVGDADSTCDRCGRLSVPTIWPHVAHPSPGVVVLFGLCAGCNGTEVAA